MHILHVVGARPNFMKAVPVIAAFGEYAVRQTLVHTGQHYDGPLLRFSSFRPEPRRASEGNAPSAPSRC